MLLARWLPVFEAMDASVRWQVREGAMDCENPMCHPGRRRRSGTQSGLNRTRQLDPGSSPGMTVENCVAKISIHPLILKHIIPLNTPLRAGLADGPRWRVVTVCELMVRQ